MSCPHGWTSPSLGMCHALFVNMLCADAQKTISKGKQTMTVWAYLKRTVLTLDILSFLHSTDLWSIISEWVSAVDPTVIVGKPSTPRAFIRITGSSRAEMPSAGWCWAGAALTSWWVRGRAHSGGHVNGIRQPPGSSGLLWDWSSLVSPWQWGCLCIFPGEALAADWNVCRFCCPTQQCGTPGSQWQSNTRRTCWDEEDIASRNNDIILTLQLEIDGKTSCHSVSLVLSGHSGPEIMSFLLFLFFSSHMCEKGSNDHFTRSIVNELSVVLWMHGVSPCLWSDSPPADSSRSGGADTPQDEVPLSVDMKGVFALFLFLSVIQGFFLSDLLGWTHRRKSPWKIRL